MTLTTVHKEFKFGFGGTKNNSFECSVLTNVVNANVHCDSDICEKQEVLSSHTLDQHFWDSLCLI